MKKIILILLLLAGNLSAQFKFGEVKGLFMGVQVGPRFPIFEMSDKLKIGVGADIVVSYSDNEYMPVFIYGMLGYQHYPGKQGFYKTSAYASYSSDVLLIAGGVRYYFKPLVENILLLMPIIDFGVEYNYQEMWNEFKPGSGRNNYVENISKFGYHVGGGFSMFMLDVITYYHRLPRNEYVSFNLRVNIPIFVKF
jgi:hypothetical protein